MDYRTKILHDVLGAATEDRANQAASIAINGCTYHEMNAQRININYYTGQPAPNKAQQRTNGGALTDVQRQNLYRICHGIAAQYSAYPAMRSVMRETWRASSMRQLADTDLQKLHQFLRILEQGYKQLAD